MQTATEVWRTKPLYDIEKITLLKKRVVDGEEFVYAELAFAGKTVRYSISTPATKWRVQTLFTKEPGTLDWIHSFRPGDVYVDVGANVGMYSVYAGVVAGARVYAFEPEAQNFAALCRSIYLNGTGQTIVPYCAAICDTPMVFSHLLLNGMLAGLSYHDFAAPSRAYDERSRFAQGCIGCSLDHLVGTSAVPTPDHVKIDVDGHEDKVIDGMRGLLGERAIRTLLLECDPGLPRTAEIVKGLDRQRLARQSGPGQAHARRPPPGRAGDGRSPGRRVRRQRHLRSQSGRRSVRHRCGGALLGRRPRADAPPRMIERNPGLPDNILLLEPKPSFGEYARAYGDRLAEHYESNGVIVVPSVPIAFDAEYFQGISFTEDLKKSLGTVNGIEKSTITRDGKDFTVNESHPFVQLFGDVLVATYVQRQVAAFNARLRQGLSILFPRYLSLEEANITWRLTETYEEGLHVDVFAKGAPLPPRRARSIA